MLRRLRNMRVLAIALAVTAGAGLGAMRANAIDLGEILKVGGISFLVKQYGSQIDKPSTALWREGFSTEYQTKVVPIISMGTVPISARSRWQARRMPWLSGGVGQLEANSWARPFA